MKTRICSKYANIPHIADAEAILRSCVHCGFCNATCPTYQEVQDERDGPRGRIYLIKNMLEGQPVSADTRKHLDRCLTCRNCETTCPSGVEYGRLLDFARPIIEREVPRGPIEAMKRWGLRTIIPNRMLLTSIVRLARLVRPLLPKTLKQKIHPHAKVQHATVKPGKRKILLLDACGQSGLTPATNIAAAHVLSVFDIELITPPKAGCCGAISYHMGQHEAAKNAARKNIDAWWPHIKAGIEAIIVTASGCGPMLTDYAHLLQDDPDYKHKAKRISTMTQDLSTILLAEDLDRLITQQSDKRLSVHIPCSLQHGLKQPSSVEKILKKTGFSLCETQEKHLCCGSAGTYSILQSDMSGRLLKRKHRALTVDNPDTIVTANIGCQLHLQGEAQIPVRHWVEVVSEVLRKET